MLVFNGSVSASAGNVVVSSTAGCVVGISVVVVVEVVVTSS